MPASDAVNETKTSEVKILTTILLIVDDLQQSQHFYVDVLGAELLQSGSPTFLRLGTAFITLNTGGGPTEDKPKVQAAPPLNSDTLSIALNLRVNDIQVAHQLWSDRGAVFLTPPVDRGEEIRCYMKDPNGYLIEVGQSLHRDDRFDD